MFTLKNIKKSYKTANFIQIALDGVSVNFRKNEFVTIFRSKWFKKNYLT